MKYLTINSISLVGTVKDDDNQIVNVSESCSNISRGIQSLQYYYDNFDSVDLKLTIQTID